MEPHRLAEERSLAYHRAVAGRLASEPGLIVAARARAERWASSGERSSPYARRWLELLALPIELLRAALVDPSETGRSLRQATPFAGALDARERWRLWREVRALAGSP